MKNGLMSNNITIRLQYIIKLNFSEPFHCLKMIILNIC